MGQMSSALAHELNQPLTAIMNYIKAAKRTLAGIEGFPTARTNELIDSAAQETLRAGAIIRNLRDLIEKRESKRSFENLNKVVEESIALGFVGAADNNVKVHLELDPELPHVLIDKIQVQQVLVNLIRNSIEAMLSGNRRELAVATARADSNFVQVTVTDTGPGLSPEVLSRLFQPFVTTKENGMGIGLTICQSIVEAHGGRIWPIEDRIAGAGFSFRLPLAEGSDLAT
jgi:C4-dicarboxylate-specific signal transduction histidine kinase